MSAARFSIGHVSRRTGIPVTTLRFYEKELPGLFPIRKTAGGHRRYGERDVERFTTVRSLAAEGVPLSELRRSLRGRGENEALAETVERLTERLESEARTFEDLRRRVDALEARLQGLESRTSRPGWFGKR
jgi:DNA-binding transcriptional MerR regulator